MVIRSRSADHHVARARAPCREKPSGPRSWCKRRYARATGPLDVSRAAVVDLLPAVVGSVLTGTALVAGARECPHPSYDIHEDSPCLNGLAYFYGAIIAVPTLVAAASSVYGFAAANACQNAQEIERHNQLPLIPTR